MRRILFLLVLFFSSTSFLHAQPPPGGELRARVVDKTSAAQLPVANALVELLLEDVPVDSATTDSSGNVRMRAPAGRYTVRTSAAGYETNTISGVVVSSDKTTYLAMPPISLAQNNFTTPDGKPATLRIKTILQMDSTQQTLESVTITIISRKDSRLVYTSASGKRGTAGFALEPGSYLVTVEKTGFEREEGISGSEDATRTTTAPLVVHIPRKGAVDFNIYMRLILPKTKVVRLVPVDDK